ncbi:MAG: helix-turn-helix transcriptional regulator [Pseudomonadota bacterium]
MSKSKFLGEFEVLVLAALTRLGDEAYGVAIANEIGARAERQVSIGALYATLARLEAKQYVISRLGESTARRGGRAKRYYRLTMKGEEQLERSARMLCSMLRGLPGWATPDP